jgi:hypothetical protein
VTAADVLAAPRLVAEAFERLRVRYYVGGSLASSTRGVPRASIDVDIAAELRPDHVDPVVAALRDRYYVPEQTVREAVAAPSGQTSSASSGWPAPHWTGSIWRAGRRS